MTASLDDMPSLVVRSVELASKTNELSEECFWAAIDLKPDLMLVDEVLAVGDSAFRERSRQAMVDLMQGAGAVVLASHNLRFVTDLCERALWLEGGKVRLDGPSDEVAAGYEASNAGAVPLAPVAPTAVLVCGVPAGGATTIAALLDAHPQAVVGMRGGGTAGRASGLDGANLWRRECFFGPPPVDAATEAKFNGATVLGHQIDEPSEALAALEAAPNGKVVFVLRDPAFAVWVRAGAPGEPATREEAESTLGEHLAAWESAVATLAAASKALGPRLLVLSQDRLFSRQGPAVLASLFRFLDLPIAVNAEARALLAGVAARVRAERQIPPGRASGSSGGRTWGVIRACSIKPGKPLAVAATANH